VERPAEPASKGPSVPFGRYVLKERLAQGGMGEVFRAVAVGESGFEKPVVIKRILPEHASRSDFAALFIAEAKLMTRLAHPNIVGVLDFGRGERGDSFLVLELVDGVDLGRLMRAHEQRGERFPVPLALHVVAQVLRGLHHAHARPESEGGGLVHRDISPGNVLLSREGEVKIADFGVALARGQEAPTRAEEEGEARGSSRRGLVGKPAYMAPEQYDGAEVDPGADLFSAGVLLYQLLTGRLPFEGATDDERQDAARRGDFGRARDLRPEVSAEIDAILRRALAPRRADRYPDARSMAQAIEALRDAGQRVAGSDDVADAVRAATVSLPTQARRVISLSASSAEPEEQELTRTGGPGGAGSFTLRVSDRSGMTLRDPTLTAPQSRPPIHTPEGPPAALPRVPASPPIEPARLEGDTLVVPLDRPLGKAARPLLVGALLLAVTVVALLQRPGAGSKDAAGLPSPSASAAPLVAPSAAPPAIDPPPPSASALPAPSAAPPHTAARPPSAAPALPSAAPVEAPPPADCTGSVRIASSGSWTVSGGPQTVQSPGVYTWRCGTFALRAVSRADAAQIKQVSVTVRPGGTALADLR
jgi:serine/threonine protein kinase